MAVGEYRGVNGVARKVVKEYRGVNGVARKVVKAYRGVNGVARKYFGAIGIWKFRYWTSKTTDSGSITVYSHSEGWEGGSIGLRADAQANSNNAASLTVVAELIDNFASGGKLEITWRSSSDPNYVDKFISFYPYENGSSLLYITVPQNVEAGKTYTNVYDIPTGTGLIRFTLDHHSATRSSEYFMIDGLVINGKRYI